MKRKIMRGCVGLMIIGLLQSATYAQSMFPDISSVNVDQITNQSEQQQQQRKTPEQTYNEQYKEQIKKIISLNQEFQCLLSEAERYAETQTSVSDRALSLKTKSESVGLTIDNMECPQDIKYSKQYLKDCNVALTKAVANLDLYDLYIVIGDGKKAKEEKDKMNTYVTQYNQSFVKAYEYYTLTKKGVVLKDDLKLKNNQFKTTYTTKYEEVKKLTDSIQEINKKVQKGENIYEEYQNIKNKALNMKLSISAPQEWKEALESINGSVESIQRLMKTFDSYMLERTSGEKEKVSKVQKEIKDLTKKLEDYNSAADQCAKDIANAQKEMDQKVKEAVKQVKEAELKEAKEHGFDTVEAYEKAKEEEQRRIEEEKRKAAEEKLKAEEKARAEARRKEMEALQKKLEEERINVYKSQSQHKYGKEFYMNRIKEDLKRDYPNSSGLQAVALSLESQAYDKMWTYINSKNANLALMQELIDEFPDDYVTVVFLYETCK